MNGVQPTSETRSDHALFFLLRGGRWGHKSSSGESLIFNIIRPLLINEARSLQGVFDYVIVILYLNSSRFVATVTAGQAEAGHDKEGDGKMEPRVMGLKPRELHHLCLTAGASVIFELTNTPFPQAR